MCVRVCVCTSIDDVECKWFEAVQSRVVTCQLRARCKCKDEYGTCRGYVDDLSCC